MAIGYDLRGLSRSTPVLSHRIVQTTYDGCPDLHEQMPKHRRRYGGRREFQREVEHSPLRHGTGQSEIRVPQGNPLGLLTARGYLPRSFDVSDRAREIMKGFFLATLHAMRCGPRKGQSCVGHLGRSRVSLDMHTPPLNKHESQLLARDQGLTNRLECLAC